MSNRNILGKEIFSRQIEMEETRDPRRKIKLDSVQNLRDLGGYSCANDRKTRWGVFFRSGDMSAVSEVDQRALLAKDIRSVIDLRMTKEIEAAPNVFVESHELFFINHDFWGTRFDNYRSIRKTATPNEKLADLYCSGLEINGFVMAEIMKTFAYQKGGFIFHCRSGKDRTGLVAAILLSIAGVPFDTICADFALSSEYLNEPELTQEELKTPGAYQKGSAPETMKLTLTFLNQRYGGVVEYLEQQGVSNAEIELIRKKIVDD